VHESDICLINLLANIILPQYSVKQINGHACVPVHGMIKYLFQFQLAVDVGSLDIDKWDGTLCWSMAARLVLWHEWLWDVTAMMLGP
jgi:hypothetical protein